MCEIFLHHHFTLTTYQLRHKNLCIVHRNQHLQKYLLIFWGVRLSQTCLYKKSQTNLSFLFESVLKLELWNIKSQFSSKLLVFWDMIWKDVSFLSLDNQFILHLWAIFHAKFWHKYKSFILVTKCEKINYSPPSIFLTIKN